MSISGWLTGSNDFEDQLAKSNYPKEEIKKTIKSARIEFNRGSITGMYRCTFKQYLAQYGWDHATLHNK